MWFAEGLRKDSIKGLSLNYLTMETLPQLRKKPFTIFERVCHEVRGSRGLLQDLNDKVR
jgi:hypothetical protein